MYSNVVKYQKENMVLKKYSIPPMLTICILTIIVSFVLITRGLLHTSHEEVSIPAMSNNIITSDETEINTSEREILTMLSSVIELPNQTDQGNTVNYIYYNTLQEYLGSSGVCLTSRQALQLQHEINDLQEVMSFEGETDITKMSLDGRKVFTYIKEQIYELCGLKLVSTKEGDIEQISDKSGNIIYAKKTLVMQESIQITVLSIILGIMVTLLYVCIIIAKKNQLFIKEVIYDGFDEERFA